MICFPFHLTARRRRKEYSSECKARPCYWKNASYTTMMCNPNSIWAWPSILCFDCSIPAVMKKALNTGSQAVINGDHIVHGLVALWCDGGAHFQLTEWWIQGQIILYWRRCVVIEVNIYIYGMYWADCWEVFLSARTKLLVWQMDVCLLNVNVWGWWGYSELGTAAFRNPLPLFPNESLL